MSRVVWAVAGIAVVVAGAAIFVRPTGNEGSADASSVILYVAPNCDPTVDACQAAKVAALEQWAVAQGGIAPTPSPSPTPTSESPSPSATPTPSPSQTPTATPTPTPTVTPPATGKALLGMSAPQGQWDQRVSEVGPGLQARRIFLTSFTASLSLASEACADGLYPVISFKTGSYSWAQVRSGAADSALATLAGRLVALPCDVFVALHHEPEGDGTAADWSGMQVRGLPILGASDQVDVGVIGNGWWWSANNNGYTDTEIAAWLTPALRGVVDVIAADTYQAGGASNPGEDGGAKMRRMSAWADRTNWTGGMGIGEFNGYTAAAITSATTALAADPQFRFGCVFNSTTGNLGVILTGDRLAAFRAALASW